MESVFPILGLTLVAAALLQLALWTAQSLYLGRLDRRRFEVDLELLQAQIAEIAARRAARQTSPSGGQTDPSIAAQPQPAQSRTPDQPLSDLWTDYRRFRITRREPESDNAVSLYLQPVDPFPLPAWLPGQHLTARFVVPGQDKPLVRCYTLSDAPGQAYYRITVKRAGPPGDDAQLPAGVVSSHVQANLAVGDELDVRPPSGKFHLQPGNEPIVLLAGGIGITPMISMINHLAATNPQRPCLLVYGVRNSADLAFGEHLSRQAEQCPGLHVIKCFSAPLPGDRPNCDYQVHGRVSLEVLRSAVASTEIDFYLCGPPGFMESLYGGLIEWGVAESRISFEAFGPATIRRRHRSAKLDAEPPATTGGTTVTLVQSGQELVWSGDHDTLLDFCESHDVTIESGCRAGSCGSCATRLLSGSVRYLDEIEDCPTGCVLPCVAIPDGPIQIEV